MKAMKANKLVCITTIIWILASLAMTNVPVQAQEAVRVYAKMPPPGYLPGQATGIVIVEVWIDSPSAWYHTSSGIVQWAISVQVDPTVLEPYGVMNPGAPGYFIYDYLTITLDPFGMTYSHQYLTPVIDKAAGTITWITAGIMPDPPTGAGGVGKLCTIGFVPLSETGYSPIDIFYDDTMDAKYWTPGGVGHPVDVVDDGHYNAPPAYAAYDCTYTGPASFPDGDPTGSTWHEVEPVPCTDWEMTGWTDNGDGKLSVSDQFELTPVEGGPTKEFHVEWVSETPEPNDGNADLMATEKIPQPEFPLGSVAPIALIAAVAYIWWVTRRKRQEAV